LDCGAFRRFCFSLRTRTPLGQKAKKSGGKAPQSKNQTLGARGIQWACKLEACPTKHKILWVFRFPPVPAGGCCFQSCCGVSAMADLIAPHGGMTEPVNRTVTAANASEFVRAAGALPRVTVSDADLSSLYRMGDGGLSPLTGPMDAATFHRVLDEECILHNGKKYAWSIPLSFPVDKERAKSLKAGQSVALVNSKNDIVATLKISDIFPFDKARYIKIVYGTERTDH